MSKKNKQRFWEKVEARLDAGDYPDLYITADGRLGLSGTGNGEILPARLVEKLPAAVVEATKIKQAELAAKRAELAAKRAEELRAEEAKTEEKIAASGHRHVWGLAGFYLEEMTGPIASWEEIRAFVRWHGFQQFSRHVDLSAVLYEGDAPTISVPLPEFFDIAGVRDRHESFSFGRIVQKFRAHLEKSRSNKAATN